MTQAPFPTHYDYSEVRKFVEEEGLLMDWAKIKEIEPGLVEHEFEQHQVEHVVMTHAIIVNELFTPKNYGWKERIFLALFFLGVIRKCG
jgi:hypothetical protein